MNRPIILCFKNPWKCAKKQTRKQRQTFEGKPQYFSPILLSETNTLASVRDGETDGQMDGNKVTDRVCEVDLGESFVEEGDLDPWGRGYWWSDYWKQQAITTRLKGSQITADRSEESFNGTWTHHFNGDNLCWCLGSKPVNDRLEIWRKCVPVVLE